LFAKFLPHLYHCGEFCGFFHLLDENKPNPYQRGRKIRLFQIEKQNLIAVGHANSRRRRFHQPLLQR
jgi:hypothetical protein